MIKSDTPLVSIITINFNSETYTLELLSSLESVAYSNFEIIVVDNGSVNNPEHSIKSKFPGVVFIRSEDNLGFAGGNNLGVEAAKGDYLFFVNNDTEFTPDLIGRLVSRFDEVPDLGVLSPKIKYHGTNIIQYAGYTPLSLTARNSALGNKQEDDNQFSAFKETAFGHGAAMMVSRVAIAESGNMPELFFLYYEELDWCEIIRRNGFKIMVDQSAVIYHKESMSIGKANPLKTYYLMRNRMLFVRRNFSVWPKFFFLIYVSLLAYPKNLIHHSLKGEWAHVKALTRGYFWNFRLFNESHD